MQTCQIMNKLISVNYWFGCDWGFYEVGYLGLRAGQLSLACAVVYLWNTGYLRVTRPRLYPGIQQSTTMIKLIMISKRSNETIVTKITCPQRMRTIQPLGIYPIWWKCPLHRWKDDGTSVAPRVT